MSVPVSPASSPSTGNVLYVGLLVAVGAATALAVLVAPVNPLVSVVPVLLVTFVYLLVKVPLRWSASLLLVLILFPDTSDESKDFWHTPFVVVGDIMNSRIDAVLGVPGLATSGTELLLVFLLVVWAYRRSRGEERRDAWSGTLPRDFLVLYVGAVAFSAAIGFLNGTGVPPWKLRNLLYPVVMLFLFQAAFRVPRDYGLLGRIIVAGAVLHSILAVIVQTVARAETGGDLSQATSHGDSILFSLAILVLLADAAERPRTASLVRAAVLVPVILVGVVENGRRTAWLMLAGMFLLAYSLDPMKGWRRSVTKALIVAAPLIALYVAAGWNSESGIFAPVHVFRSVSDTQTDGSAYWREVENWNLAMSMRESPLLGIGLGARYTEHMHNVDISSVYKEYREWPHNTLFGLFLFMGLFAFTAIWAIYALGIFLAARSYRLTASPEHRVAALACMGGIVCCFLMAYGDTGAHYPQYNTCLGLALAIAPKVAGATGAWPRVVRPG